MAGLIILFTNQLNTALPQMGLNIGLKMPFSATTVYAQEIYEMFTCPCCGQPLRKEDPCCGAMIQMVDFIDQRVSAGANKEGVVLATVQEFGLDRLANEAERAGLRAQLIANAPDDAPKILLAETSQDLGVVSMSEGIATTEFNLKNEGASDLVIDKLSSSCGCTSASVIYQGEESPRFYMVGHGYDEPDSNWRLILPAGEQAVVKVYYDPTVHPDLFGPVTREISIHSNDPVDFEAKLIITLDQER